MSQVKKRKPRTFDVFGPFEMELGARNKFKIVGADEWLSSSGCYIVGTMMDRKITPYYVGKTEVSFATEMFTSHKRLKYLEILNQTGNEKLVAFLVVPNKKVTILTQLLDNVEKSFIALAYAQNRDLVNIRDLPKDPWCIAGINDGESGKATPAALAFKEMMGLGE